MRTRTPLLFVGLVALLAASVVEAAPTSAATLDVLSATVVGDAKFDAPDDGGVVVEKRGTPTPKRPKKGKPDNPGRSGAARGRGRPAWAGTGGRGGPFTVPASAFGGGAVDSRLTLDTALIEAATDPTAPDFVRPVDGRLTSRFSGRHGGIDIAVSYQAVAVAADGRVLFVGGHSCCSYGRYVDVQHADGYVTRYAHLFSFTVRAGDVVEQGDVIGISGDSGRSTGPHLHFEILRDGIAQNPLLLLR
ncbi:MAG: M23 family metallopeptidase [Dehalococcoidia bacterium]